MLFNLSACLTFLDLPVSSHLFSTHSYFKLAAGSRGGTSWIFRGGYISSPFSLWASSQMPPLPLHPFLTTWSRGSVFCWSWRALSKSLSFTVSACAARLTKNADPFFPAWSASSGIVCNPLPPPHTTPFLRHQMLHVQGRPEMRGKKLSIFMKTNWTRAVACRYTPSRKVRSR